MPAKTSYNLNLPVTSSAGVSGISSEQETQNPIDSFLGFGLLRPFVRDAADFAKGGGADQIKSSIGQILGTRAESERSGGELPWRPTFGSKLHLIRHRKGPVVNAMAGSFIREAIERWEPRVELVQVTTEFDRETRVRNILVRFRIIDQNVAGNNVILPDDILVAVTQPEIV